MGSSFEEQLYTAALNRSFGEQLWGLALERNFGQLSGAALENSFGEPLSGTGLTHSGFGATAILYIQKNNI